MGYSDNQEQLADSSPTTTKDLNFDADLPMDDPSERTRTNKPMQPVISMGMSAKRPHESIRFPAKP